MSRTYTTETINAIARGLEIEVRALKALLSVEALGSGFLADGRPKILLERHKFSRFTAGRFDASHPDLSNPKPGGYLGSTKEYGRLYRAMNLEPLPGQLPIEPGVVAEAALRACSWGMPQIMGFNWKRCGEKSLFGFLMAMHHNEDAQLRMLQGFIASDPDLLAALRELNWPEVARLYNGEDYARNHYDARLASAYAAAT